MSDVPVLLVTARVEQLDRLVGFRLGADDYVLKPFDAAEVVARVIAVLRRASAGGTAGETSIRVGDLLVDTVAMTASIGDERIALTPTEYEILAHLVRHPRRAFGRGELLAAAVPDSHAFDRVVDAHVGALRRKLATAGAPDLIETVRGVGYRLWPPEGRGAAR